MDAARKAAAGAVGAGKAAVGAARAAGKAAAAAEEARDNLTSAADAMKAAAINKAAELKGCGVPLADLHHAGYTATQLKAPDDD